MYAFFCKRGKSWQVEVRDSSDMSNGRTLSVQMFDDKRLARTWCAAIGAVVWNA